MSLPRLRILHFNDAYEVEKAPHFLRQWASAGGPDALRLFSGDILNPSFLSTHFKGHQFVPFFRRLPLDAAAIGNHEFDFGVDEFQAINAKAKVPWLISNYKHRGSGENFLGFNATFIKNVGGFKVGVVGLVDKSWEDTSMLDAKQFTLVDPVESSLQTCKQFKAQGCDFIVALTHMDTESDERLLDLNPDIDLVLGGHNHVYLAEKRGRGLLVKSGCDFKFFSEIVFSPDAGDLKYPAETPEKGLVLDDSTSDARTVSWQLKKNVGGKEALFSVSLTRHKTDFSGDFDPDMKREADEFVAQMSAQKLVPVGFLEEEMNVKSMHIRANESKMGNLITDLIRIALDVDVAMVQSGHIRAEQTFPAKHVYRNVDMISTFPIQDTFNISEATGADLDAIMEEGVQHAPQPRGSFPNVSGMELRYHASKPPLDRITKKDMKIGISPVDYQRKYTIATIGWITRGGDGFTRMIGLKTLPLKRELTCLDVLRKFLQLPLLKENREEFLAVKAEVDKHALGKLIDWRKRGGPEQKTVERVTPAVLAEHKGDLKKLLGCLTQEAAERVLMYRLPTGMVEVEGHWVFTLDGRTEGRVIQMD